MTTTIERPPVQPPLSGPEQPSNDPNEKKGNHKVRNRVIGATAVVAVLGAGSVVAAVNLLPKAETTVSGAPSNPNNNPDDLDSGTITIEIPAETLANLSPEQITEKLSIPALGTNGETVNPEAYASSFVNSYEAVLNSGITEEEFGPFINTPAGEYEGAMQAKYDPAGSSALFVEGAEKGGLENNHQVNLSIASIGFGLESGQFKQNVALTNTEIVEPQTSPEDDFTVKITLNYTSNAQELGLVDFAEAAGKDISTMDREVTYLLHVTNVGGDLKTNMSLAE